MEPYKYLLNFIQMPAVLALFLVGVVLVLFGIGKTIWKRGFDQRYLVCRFRYGIYRAGITAYSRL